MENTTISRRPLLDLMLERANKDWGENPVDNPEYRKIRWPGIPWQVTDMSNIINHAAHLGNVWGEPTIDPLTPRVPLQSLHGPGRRVAQKPQWKLRMEDHRRRKTQGFWNGGLSNMRRGFSRQDTHASLRFDLFSCMKENIPFKTRSLEYKPQDQWVYIKGTPVVKYDIYKGEIEGFTYSGVYDKVITLMLRHIFYLDIKLVRRNLIWYERSFAYWGANVRPRELARSGTLEPVETPILLEGFYIPIAKPRMWLINPLLELERSNSQLELNHDGDSSSETPTL